MDDLASRAEELNRALRRVQWSVLGGIAVCALVALASAPAAAGLEVDRRFTAGGVALAAGSILTRRTSVRTPGQLAIALASPLLAGAIGLLAVAVALSGAERQTALLFALGAALLAARPPARMAP
jgi:hypothetical protein